MSATHNQDVHIWTCSPCGDSQVPSARSLRQEAAHTALQEATGVFADHSTVSCEHHSSSQSWYTLLSFDLAMQLQRLIFIRPRGTALYTLMNRLESDVYCALEIDCLTWQLCNGEIDACRVSDDFSSQRTMFSISSAAQELHDFVWLR